ncbi:hypothetical protein BD770DRAFT_383687 [Pilaira anomala]|nr:hypothetical protein BD770DRAFT_383687 [Pilaira anomala]
MKFLFILCCHILPYVPIFYLMSLSSIFLHFTLLFIYLITLFYTFAYIFIFSFYVSTPYVFVLYTLMTLLLDTIIWFFFLYFNHK